jgi:2-polyprenyl-3-methyl-5-hydroxy-6-metoxy-1,4-benzoquinol methylase
LVVVAFLASKTRRESLNRDELIAEARNHSWFHSIDFGDYVSPSRTAVKSIPNGTLQPVWEFFKHLDLHNRDCMDIGAADGIVAFTMKQMGARRVVATDGVSRRQFLIARDLLELDVEYVDNLMDVDLGRRFEAESFDVIVMAGFLYHLWSPLAAIAACRRILKAGRNTYHGSLLHRRRGADHDPQHGD